MKNNSFKLELGKHKKTAPLLVDTKIPKLTLRVKSPWLNPGKCEDTFTLTGNKGFKLQKSVSEGRSVDLDDGQWLEFDYMLSSDPKEKYTLTHYSNDTKSSFVYFKEELYSTFDTPMSKKNLEEMSLAKFKVVEVLRETSTSTVYLYLSPNINVAAFFYRSEIHASKDKIESLDYGSKDSEQYDGEFGFDKFDISIMYPTWSILYQELDIETRYKATNHSCKYLCPYISMAAPPNETSPSVVVIYMRLEKGKNFSDEKSQKDYSVNVQSSDCSSVSVSVGRIVEPNRVGLNRKLSVYKGEKKEIVPLTLTCFNAFSSEIEVTVKIDAVVIGKLLLYPNKEVYEVVIQPVKVNIDSAHAGREYNKYLTEERLENLETLKGLEASKNKLKKLNGSDNLNRINELNKNIKVLNKDLKALKIENLANIIKRFNGNSFNQAHVYAKLSSYIHEINFKESEWFGKEDDNLTTEYKTYKKILLERYKSSFPSHYILTRLDKFLEDNRYGDLEKRIGKENTKYADIIGSVNKFWEDFNEELPEKDFVRYLSDQELSAKNVRQGVIYLYYTDYAKLMATPGLETAKAVSDFESFTVIAFSEIMNDPSEVIHEIGHSMGLSHDFDYAAFETRMHNLNEKTVQKSDSRKSLLKKNEKYSDQEQIIKLTRKVFEHKNPTLETNESPTELERQLHRAYRVNVISYLNKKSRRECLEDQQAVAKSLSDFCSIFKVETENLHMAGLARLSKRKSYRGKTMESYMDYGTRKPRGIKEGSKVGGFHRKVFYKWQWDVCRKNLKLRWFKTKE